MRTLPIIPAGFEHPVTCPVCHRPPYSHLVDIGDNMVRYGAACFCAGTRRTVLEWCNRWAPTLEVA